MSLTGVHPFLHFTVRAHLSVFQKFGFVTHPRSSLPLSHQTPLSRTQATHGFSHFRSHKILSSSFLLLLLFHFAPSTNEEEASWKTTTKTKTKTKRTKTEESRRRPPPPPPPPRIVSPFLFRSLLLCVKSRPMSFQSTKKQRGRRRQKVSLFSALFFVRCFVLFPFFQLLLFSLFFSFFLSSFVFCVFFTYKKTSLSLLCCATTPLKEEEEEEEEERRWRPRRRATLRRTRRRLPREVRARGIFSRGGVHFSLLLRIHTREKKEQSLLVVFCVRKAAIESALFSSTQCNSLFLSLSLCLPRFRFPRTRFVSAIGDESR